MPDLIQTPSQTVGPFFGFALPYDGDDRLLAPHDPRAIRVHGTITDGAGEPVPDAFLELWQADASGTISRERGSLERNDHDFTGFGRAGTDRAGHYSFTTLKPGAVGESAPYLLLTIFSRGLSQHLFTRAYFPEDAAAHASDRALRAVTVERRETLVCSADGPASYRFDIRLQGESETVFFEFHD